MRRAIPLALLLLLASLAAHAASGVTQLISQASGAPAVRYASSFFDSISGDGRYVAFLSFGADMAPGVGPGGSVFVRDTSTGRLELISQSTGGAVGNQFCWNPVISRDGRFVAFASFSTNLTPETAPGGSNVFVRDRLAGTTECVSLIDPVSSPNNYSGGSAMAISADGRYVVFDSAATDLAGGDTSFIGQLYLRDRLTGTTERLSASASGDRADGSTFRAVISGDGRYVAFGSYGTNLVPDDTNGVADVFVRDRVAGTIERVSITSSGAEGDLDSGDPAITDDGRFVAFDSGAALNGGLFRGGIFIRDRQAGTTEVAFRGFDGSLPNNGSSVPALTPDGRVLAFQSYASNLVPGSDANGAGVYVVSRETGLIERISASPSGGPAHFTDLALAAPFSAPALCVDGSFVAFESAADNLVAGDTNHEFDVFVRRRGTQSTLRVSVTPNGDQPVMNATSQAPNLSPDGRYVTFVSDAFNLVPGDTNYTDDVFLADRQSGAIERISVSTAGEEGNGSSQSQFNGYDSPGRPALTPDGRFVVFLSAASNLVPGDTNGQADVFLRDRAFHTTERVNLSAGGLQDPRGAPNADLAISADGRYVAFTSEGSLLPDDTNKYADVYVRDRVRGTVERVSVGARDTEADGPSYGVSMSADGRYVAFASYADNLVPGDTNQSLDVFVRDRLRRTTERVSLSVRGGQGAESSYEPSISADGRFVSFTSYARNLVGGGATNGTDVFLRDRLRNTTERISVDNSGAPLSDPSGLSSVNADGSLVSFVTVPNNPPVLLLRDRAARSTTQLNAAPPLGAPSVGYSYGYYDSAPALAARVRAVAFSSQEAELGASTPVGYQVYVREQPSVPGVGGTLQVPAQFSAGSAPVGQLVTRSLPVRNTNRIETLQILVSASTGPFSSGAPGLISIPPGGTYALSIAFQPAAKGKAQGALSLHSSDPAHPQVTIKLTGTGT